VSAWCCRRVLALIAWACAVGCANDSWTYRARDASRDLPSAEGVDAVARDDAAQDGAAREDVAHEDAALPDTAPDEMTTTFDAISPPDGAHDVTAPEVRDASCSDGSSPCEGRCVDLSSDPQHCGTCAARCVRPNAIAACAAGECRLVRCQDGWMDCNRGAADGCERDVRSDPANCGGCGLTCSFPEATARCTEGRCAVAACARTLPRLRRRRGQRLRGRPDRRRPPLRRLRPRVPERNALLGRLREQRSVRGLRGHRATDGRDLDRRLCAARGRASDP
jgi:hypothetical protein